MPISAIDAISPAFQHAKQQLLQPFRLSQWGKLALVGFLAGELSSGGCNGGNFSNFQKPHSTQRSFPNMPDIDPTILVPLIVVIVVAGIVLWFVFVYLNSMMRFVLFDSVIAKECKIRESWGRRQDAGRRLFVWQLLFAFVNLAVMVIVVGIPAGIAFALGWFTQPKEHWVPLLLAGIVLFFFFVAVVILSLIVQLLTRDFVVPQMAIEGIDAIEGWRRLLPKLRAEIGGYAGYVGMRILLRIGAAIIFGIVAFVAALIFLLPVGGLSFVAIMAGKAAGLTWDLYTITAAVVTGSILLACILYLVSLISVPGIVFFPAYSLYFFAARYAPLQWLLHPVAPPPIAPPILPPMPDWPRNPDAISGTS